MEECKSCGGNKKYEVFTHSESGNKIKGHDLLNSLVYKKTNEIIKFYEDQYNSLTTKPAINSDFIKGDPSFAYVMQKFLKDPQAVQIQKDESKEYYKYVAEIKVCQDCSQVYMQYMLRSKGKLVHLGLIEDLIKDNTISKSLNKLIGKDSTGFCLSGKPRNGKTLFLKYTYNKILNQIQEPNKMLWLTEMELFQKFREEKDFNSFMKTLKNYDYIFIDELFAVENWKDASADRDKASVAHRNNFTFWDTICDANKFIFCTTNQVFGMFKPSQASERIIQRISEVCKIEEIE
jgi:hypothetical protein